MRARTKTGATKRLADLEPGDVIVIDLGGSTAIVESNEPDTSPSLRARGLFQTRFLMDNGRPGGWTGRADSLITIAAQSENG